MSQPEASFALSRAAQCTEPTVDDAKLLNKCLEWQSTNAIKGLRFPKLNAEALKLMVFVDASFASSTRSDGSTATATLLTR